MSFEIITSEKIKRSKYLLSDINKNYATDNEEHTGTSVVNTQHQPLQKQAFAKPEKNCRLS